MVAKTKDSSIELLRIVAGLLVISAHLIGTYIIYNHKFSPILLLGDVITRGSVPAFFMITGYFMDRNKSILKQYKGFFRKVIIPSLLTIIFCGIVIPILTEILLNTDEQIPTFRQAIWLIVSGKIDQFQHCFHLWYIVELFKCYIFLPVLQLLCATDEKITKIRRYVLLVGLYAGVIIPSIGTIKGTMETVPFYFMPFTIYMWYILLGYEIRQWMNNGKQSNRRGFLGGILLIVGVVGLYISAYFGDYLLNGRVLNIYFANYYVFVVMESIGLMLLLTSIKITSLKLQKIINCIGQTTFGVYLIHPIIYSVIWHMNIESLIPIIGLEGFLTVFILLTFICSVGTVFILEDIIEKIKKKIKTDRGWEFDR